MLDAFGVGAARTQGTGLLGQPAALLDRVETDDPDSGGDEQPHDELADEAEPDDARASRRAATSPRRTPCIAIAPTVANAACSGATPSGTGTQRFIGTQLTSACSAYSLPAHATSWPTANSSAPAPTSTTTPHSE